MNKEKRGDKDRRCINIDKIKDLKTIKHLFGDIFENGGSLRVKHKDIVYYCVGGIDGILFKYVKHKVYSYQLDKNKWVLLEGLSELC